MKISKVFPDFKKITTQCELRRTLEFIIGRVTYRVEVLYCYSNPKSPWVAKPTPKNAAAGKASPTSLGSAKRTKRLQFGLR